MSTNHIHNAGPITIFSSTVGAGEWYAVHPSIRNLTFEARITGSSVGAAVSHEVTLEGSHNGTSTDGYVLDTLTFSSTASLTSPQVQAGSIDAHYPFVRINTGTGTTSAASQTVAVATAGHMVSL